MLGGGGGEEEGVRRSSHGVWQEDGEFSYPFLFSSEQAKIFIPLFDSVVADFFFLFSTFLIRRERESDCVCVRICNYFGLIQMCLDGAEEDT